MSIDLLPDWKIGDLSLTTYPFSVDADSSVDVGEPDLIVEDVLQGEADGNPVSLVRVGNRTYSLEIFVEGASLADLSLHEATLRDTLATAGLLLTHDPGDGLAVPSVYEVRMARLTPHRQDEFESNVIRKFTLSMTCSPWARSLNPVTVSAIEVTGPATTTTIDTCDSATNWTATIDGSPAPVDTGWSPGAVSVIELFQPGGQALALKRTATVNFSANRYLVIEAGFNAANGAVPIEVTVTKTGSTFPQKLNKVSQQSLGASWFRCVYDTGGISTSSMMVSAYIPMDAGDLKVRDVAASNRPGTMPRQQSQIITPGGTERTPASIHVQSANGTDALGLTIVHTCPDDGSGYSPPLQRWRTVGQTRTADATAYSGNYELINVTSWVAEVPTAALPTGAYTLLARLRCQTASTVRVSYSTSTIFPDTTTQQGFTLGQVDWSFAAANVWELVPLAVLSLPSVRTSAGKVQIALQVEAASPAVTLDEAWLFRVDDDCALTIVDSARPHLWLDSPNSSSLVPRVSIGNGMTSQVHPGSGLKAMGAHVLSQPSTAVFTAAFTDFAKTDATFYRRFHTNATE